tara:strand:+ start:150 stop:809 length:660 start_codon:yes stop_codon:yes gene_type:complete
MEDVDERYENAVIYVMKHKTDDTKDFYIGSSYDFKKRCWTHKSNCKNENKKNNLKVYKYIRGNGGWNEWTIVKLYDYPCKNKYQLELEEKKAVKEYKSTLNSQIPTRCYKEWEGDNLERLKEYRKGYYKDNKDKILQIRNEDYKNNKEKKLQYQKQYRKDNKEIIAQKSKEYRKDNKEKIEGKRGIKINCDICNRLVRKGDISTHKKSLICMNYQKSHV